MRKRREGHLLVLKNSKSKPCSTICRINTHHDTRARQRMKQVITPLLEGIALKCGFTCVTLVAGAPPVKEDDPYTIANVHYGECKDPIPVNFQAFDPEGYGGHVLGQFAKFLSAVGGTIFYLPRLAQATDLKM